MVKSPHSNAEGIGLIPGWGTKIPHAAWLTKKKKKKIVGIKETIQSLKTKVNLKNRI